MTLFVKFSLFAQDTNIRVFPRQRLFPLIFTDIKDPMTFISFDKMLEKGDFPFDYYIPFSIGFSKGILKVKETQIDLACAAFTQFGWRWEDNIYLHGMRKSMINSDYLIGINCSHKFNEKFYGKAKLFHQSSHLGDDYLLLYPIKNASGYWVNDPSSYEQLELTMLYKIGYINTFGGIGYVVSPKTIRKRSSFKLGANISDYRSEKNVTPVMGFELNVLENNNFNPGLKCNLGLKFFKEKSVYMMLEYYYGHLPYSRLESQMIVNYLGLGLYLDTFF
ncbi:MAG: DUF1207 domain-containing protein [Bacteroidota bacterium]|nr:DUF1207 domain-containing protein [Bacteroidota bacterium]